MSKLNNYSTRVLSKCLLLYYHCNLTTLLPSRNFHCSQQQKKSVLSHLWPKEQVWYIPPTQARDSQTLPRVVTRAQPEGQPEEKSDLPELGLEEYNQIDAEK